MIETRVGSIENAEAVLARFDFEKRHDHTVDAVHIPIELLYPKRVFYGAVNHCGIVEGAVAVEETVLQHKWHLELAAGKVQCPFGFVSDEIKASQASIDIEAGDAHAVIVIPQRSGGLAIGIERWSRIEVWTVFVVRREPGFRIAIVVRQNARSVDVRDIAYLWDGRLGSVDGMVDTQKMLGGQLARPVDTDGLSALRLDGGPRPGTVVSPKCGRR